MRVGKRLFPYPTLSNQQIVSGFKTSSFSFDYEMIKEDDLILLNNLRYDTDNENLEVLIEDNKAKVVCIVECSTTLFRETYEISKVFKTVRIPIHKLKGKVVISAFAYATEDIENYSDSDFLDDYSDYTFNIEKYDILASDDGFTTKIKYDDTEDDKVSSIFLVIKDFENNTERIKVQESRSKIKILVPEKQFGIYDKMKMNTHFQNLFFSLLIVPALSYVIQKIKNYDVESIRLDYDWFNSIESKYKEIYDEELNNEILGEISGIELAQVLMNFPITKGIDELFTLTMNEIVGDDDFE